MKKSNNKSVKCLSLVLMLSLLATVFSIIPVSAAHENLYDSNIRYNADKIQIVNNTDGSVRINYTADNKYYESIKTATAYFPGKELTYEFSDINMLDNSSYSIINTFGNTWQDQNFDKGGFTVFYNTNGDFRVFTSNTGTSPSEGDSNAINVSIEPLSVQGYKLTVQLLYSNKYLITVDNHSNAYSYIYDATHALNTYNNNSFSNTTSLEVSTALTTYGTGSLNATKAGSFFTLKKTNSFESAEIPDEFEGLLTNKTVKWYYNTTTEGKLRIRNTGSNFWNRTYFKNDYNNIFSAATSVGLTLNIKDIFSAQCENYALAIGLCGDWQAGWYDNAKAVMLLYSSNGKFVVAQTNGNTDAGAWEILGSADFKTNSVEALRDLNLNIKFADGKYILVANEEKFEIAADKLNESGRISVGLGIMNGFTIENNKISGLLNQPSIAKNDCVSFTVDRFENTVKLSEIRFDRNDKYMSMGDTWKITPELTPADADATITYQSSAAAVASVDNSGLVTANLEGTAIITATANDGAIKTTLNVVVLSPASSDLPETIRGASKSFNFQRTDNIIRVNHCATRHGYERLALLKTFKPGSEKLNLKFSDITADTDDYSIVVGIFDYNTENQWYDSNAIMMVFGKSGNYAVVKTRKDAFMSAGVLTCGKLSMAPTAELGIEIAYADGKYSATVNGETFSFDASSLSNAGNIKIGIGTMSDFNITDSEISELKIWEDLSGTVSFCLNKSEITLDNRPVKTLKPFAKYEAFFSINSDGKFGIEDNLTRGEAIIAVAKLLADEEDINSAKTFASSFTDISSDDPNYGYYAYMEKNDYLPVEFKGKLLPNNLVTRGQLVDLLLNHNSDITTVAISDVSTDDIVYNKICQAINSGLFTLDADGKFGIYNAIKKADAAQVICKYLGKELTDNFVPALLPSDLIAGNANADEVLDIRDLIRLKKLLEGQNYVLAADFNLDAKNDATDLPALQKLLLGVEQGSKLQDYLNCAILSLNKLEYDTVTYTVTSKNSSGIQATLDEILSLSQDTLANVVLQDGTYNISEPIVINNNDSDKKKSNRYKEC